MGCFNLAVKCHVLGYHLLLKIAILVSIKDENTTKSNQMWAEDNIYTVNLY
jgi:hypothetical protein